MINVDEILKLFSGRYLENEKSGLTQDEFNSIADKLERAGYAKVHRSEEIGSCVIVLNEHGLKKKQSII
jgi:DNA-binding MarR family transcriptional regulator